MSSFPRSLTTVLLRIRRPTDLVSPAGGCQSGHDPIARDRMKRPLLLASLGLSVLLSTSAYGQSQGPVLTGHAAIERIIGNTMVFIPKESIPAIDVKSLIYFNPDGRATMRIIANGQPGEAEKTEIETGTWSIDDQERLCVVSEGNTLRETDCIGLTVKGDTVSSTPDDTLHRATVTLVKGNPYGL